MRYQCINFNSLHARRFKKRLTIITVGTFIFVYFYLAFYLPSTNNDFILTKYYFKPQDDEQMLKVYSNIHFEKYYSLGKKNYFDVTYDTKNKKDMRKINVFLIPHTHDDPGWLKTFEEYYNDDVSRILYGMLNYLSKKNKMKFVYVEMSFFELFYSTLSLLNRQKVKRLLDNEKLEILTGGWVMTDEANSHFFSQIVQLFEGHEFLKNNLQYIPKNHWSIDPFGLSPTMAYIIKESGFKHMAIQRVHYLVKHYFAIRKLFEFQWRQLWSGGHINESNKTDIFTHILPYGSYTSTDTCGPDRYVCSMFDFNQYTNALYYKNGGKEVIEQDAKNIADQFRKKSLLFRGPNIFVPLGADFTFKLREEWESVYENYKIIIEKINNSPELNMNVQFGTLNDYFNANDKSISKDNIRIPIITGDFFTYADRDEDYWSGYYTSRPFYKRFDRNLIDYLRSAEIIYSIVLGKTNFYEMNQFLKFVDYNKLVYARRALSLFQHHDGVTGTARDHVVLDYGKKLFKAIQNCYSIIEKCIQYDMTKQIFNISQISVLKKVNNPVKMTRIRKFNIKKNILVFNPHTRNIDKEIICTKISGQKLFIIEGIDIKNQEIHPTIKKKNGNLIITNKSYKLCFITSFKALEVKIFKLTTPEIVGNMPNIAKIYTSKKNILTNDIFVNYESIDYKKYDDKFIVSEIHGLKINTKTGYIISINNLPVSVNYEYYKETTVSTNSGAYLFSPDGPSIPLNALDNSYIISKGILYQKVVINGPKKYNLVQSIETKITSPHYIDIYNIINIDDQVETEIAMKIKTNKMGKKFMIKNKNVFYTDLNGYQIIKRKRLNKLPIQGNFYPMPSTIFIQDNKTRLTVLSNQPLGCSSQEEGSVEVILDRKHFFDDFRGLEQGVTDNLATRSKFRILVEDVNKFNQFENEKFDNSFVTGYLSANAFLANQMLQYNLIQMEIDKTITDMDYKLSILKNELPHNIHIVTLRTLTSPENYGKGGLPDNEYERVRRKPLKSAALILQNIAYDNRVGDNLSGKIYIKNGEINMSEYFIDKFIALYQKTSLTMLYESKEYTKSGYINIKPMELKTLKVDFS
ncbi:Alpha-mannosidase 2x [Strongyloides ratti]|uniref:Alpha-mannosidase n=1 Tax=Strongyloides ratti TaxID=34506 RepID=A0A090N028_STRRB|nr:Alpha-mannosidase 2x [Strongyloides ratti]CEF69960.1 Alpha-mannosidase 2x [Strongyloides ratti]